MKFLSILFLALSASAAEVRLAWDAIPEPWVAGYRVKAGTNDLAYATNVLRVVDCGTNTTLLVDELKPATWHFVAHAYTSNKVENPPSNELLVFVPGTATKLMTVTLQWNATVAGTSWQDCGVFRVKLSP